MRHFYGTVKAIDLDERTVTLRLVNDESEIRKLALVMLGKCEVELSAPDVAAYPLASVLACDPPKETNG